MRRELILEVAYQKFAEKGYNIPLTEIAAAAGIKKQSIYNYFESKVLSQKAFGPYFYGLRAFLVYWNFGAYRTRYSKSWLCKKKRQPVWQSCEIVLGLV